MANVKDSKQNHLLQYLDILIACQPLLLEIYHIFIANIPFEW